MAVDGAAAAPHGVTLSPSALLRWISVVDVDVVDVVDNVDDVVDV